MDNIDYTSSNLELDNKILYDEAKIISLWIQQENKEQWYHMINKDPDTIMVECTKNGCCVVRESWKIVWFMNLTLIMNDWIILLEAWSLIVDKIYRWKWIWHLLEEKLFKKNSYKNIFVVTNVDKVKVINESLWNVALRREEIHEEILNIIELNWKLLYNDVVYFNKKLLDLHNNLEKTW